MYKNIASLIEICEEKSIPIWKAVVENEIKFNGSSEQEIMALMKNRYEIMLHSVNKCLEGPNSHSDTLINGIAATQNNHANGNNLCGSFINKVMAYALSCSEMNAQMGRICAAPTAGSCGIVPAVIAGCAEKLTLNEEQILHALITCGGIGAIFMKNATVAGAEGGCQAECGVAAAMASCAVVEAMGGSPMQCATAISFTLINCMGLVCDPVAGLVQVPCAHRNASQAVNALISADLALSGMDFLIPPDEVLESMYSVGKMLPHALKETALGGIAATATAKRVTKKIFS